MYSGKKAITPSSICKIKTRLWGVWDLPASNVVIRRPTWTARYGSCRGCMKHMNPTKGNAICKWNICRKESACCYFCKSTRDLHGTRLSRNRCTHCMVFFVCLFLHEHTYNEKGKNVIKKHFFVEDMLGKKKKEVLPSVAAVIKRHTVLRCMEAVRKLSRRQTDGETAYERQDPWIPNDCCCCSDLLCRSSGVGCVGNFFKKRIVEHEQGSSCKQMTCLTVAQKTEFCVWDCLWRGRCSEIVILNSCAST